MDRTDLRSRATQTTQTLHGDELEHAKIEVGISVCNAGQHVGMVWCQKLRRFHVKRSLR
jgi:hypothetical protein